MARLEGVKVEKLQGGLNRLATGTDNHVALIFGGIPVGAIATAVNNAGKGVVLASVYDAEVLGINESFDANNNCLLYADIVEFFEYAPTATLYLFNSTVKADIKTFINQNKEIKGYGFALDYNSEAPNLIATINEQQLIADEFAAENRLIDFAFLGFNNLDDYTEDLFALTAPIVSTFVNCSDASGTVRIGAALGMLAVRKINENLGSVNIENKPLAKRGALDYPLTDEKKGLWIESYLPNGETVDSQDKAVLTALRNKGYIAAVAYEGYSGFFFDNSYTCVDRESDFAFIENNRTWNKAARIIRTTLIPEVKGRVKKDPTTGFIASTTVSRWTGLVNKALEGMQTADEISGFDVYINEKQIVNQDSPVKVKAMIVADGIVHEFEVAVGLTNSI
ncbi:hypothetical protein GCM10008015_26810 [Flavobacterium palustre]|uniref:DUF2586 domain-containing protein n=1 Tax=Flavobacterium palustre TaxID=1476463 RepID=A0ABQ1HQA9_9FLAO|nr:DUF2586 family protein [Flavobacterium palustre]GGA84667.1 hypothetical protein GCM10008015_26810 [Flavobacterium palustre]